MPHKIIKNTHKPQIHKDFLKKKPQSRGFFEICSIIAQRQL
jgi:hypothetical protein